jgi:voltage-gated potassium channel
MVSFLATLLRLIRAVGRALHDPEFRALLIVLLLLLVSGTAFYSTVEGWAWVDALYFCVATASTVGYGDLAPKTQFGKAFTMIYIAVGVGVFITLAGKLAGTMMRGTHKDERAETGGDG